MELKHVKLKDCGIPEEREEIRVNLPTSNRFSELPEVEWSGEQTEVCIAGTVVKNLHSKSKWRVEKKSEELCVLRKTHKPVVVLKTKDHCWNALLDTGSERCILNYSNYKCLKNEPIKESSVKIRGVAGTTEVVGEVSLNLEFSPTEKVSVDALIIKDSNFDYDLILGRDILNDGELNLREGHLKIRGEVIEFLDKKSSGKKLIKDSDCLLSDVVLQKYRTHKKKIIRKLNGATKELAPNEVKGDEEIVDLEEYIMGVAVNVAEKTAEANHEIKVRVNRKRQKKEKNVWRSPKVHVNSQTVKANTMTHVNAFVKHCPMGEYFIEKKMCRNGLIIAEALVKISSQNNDGVHVCPLLMINPLDEDISLKENEMLGTLIKYDKSEVSCESYLSTIAESLKVNYEDSEVDFDYSVSSDGMPKSLRNSEVSNDTELHVENFKTLSTSTSCNLNVADKELLKRHNKVKCTRTDDVSSKVVASLVSSQNNRRNLMEDVSNKANNRRMLSTADVHCESITYHSELTNTLNEYRDVITLENESIGITNVLKHQIKVKENAEVINKLPYKIPHRYREELEKVTNEMSEEGIIEPSMSSWNFPVIIVKKKSGDIRPVIDFRSLNRVVILESYPLPRIDEVLSTLGGNTIFSHIDLKSAFHQIELTEDSKKYTAFSVNFKKYQFTKLPFGYTNSPSVFQSVMCQALNNIIGKLCFVFIDDILIFSRSIDEHLADIKSVLANLRASNLSIKLEKCSFYKESIEYLGHIINKEGIKCVQNEKLRNMARPKNVEELQRFLGLANFFRKFIPVFSRIAYPLYQLLRKDVQFLWDEHCEESFEKLRNSLIGDTVLAHPNYKLPFYLFTDACNLGIGAALMQSSNASKDLRPVAFFSKSLNNAQKRYSTTKKEFFAIHSALKEFQYLILGYEVIVLTDHKPLAPLFSKKLPLDSAMARWCIEAEPYNCSVKYFAGKKI